MQSENLEIMERKSLEITPIRFTTIHRMTKYIVIHNPNHTFQIVPYKCFCYKMTRHSIFMANFLYRVLSCCDIKPSCVTG